MIWDTIRILNEGHTSSWTAGKPGLTMLALIKEADKIREMISERKEREEQFKSAIAIAKMYSSSNILLLSQMNPRPNSSWMFASNVELQVAL